MKTITIYLSTILLLLSCTGGKTGNMAGTVDNAAIVAEAQDFINSYTDGLLGLYYAAAEAQWQSNTMIIEGDTTNSHRTNKMNEALAAYLGNVESINRARYFLEKKES